MNWRYIVGKSLSELSNFILSSNFMPLTRIMPPGINYPYDIKRFYKQKQIKTIFDVGANIGQTSLFFNRHFPQANIFAFEPPKFYGSIDLMVRSQVNLLPTFNSTLSIVL